MIKHANIGVTRCYTQHQPQTPVENAKESREGDGFDKLTALSYFSGWKTRPMLRRDVIPQ